MVSLEKQVVIKGDADLDALLKMAEYARGFIDAMNRGEISEQNLRLPNADERAKVKDLSLTIFNTLRDD